MRFNFRDSMVVGSSVLAIGIAATLGDCSYHQRQREDLRKEWKDKFDRSFEYNQTYGPVSFVSTLGEITTVSLRVGDKK